MVSNDPGINLGPPGPVNHNPGEFPRDAVRLPDSLAPANPNLTLYTGTPPSSPSTQCSALTPPPPLAPPLVLGLDATFLALDVDTKNV
jgi:hypothetical protein